MFARPFIDSLDFARLGKELHGEIPLAEFPRLGDLLLIQSGSVQFVLRGWHSEAQQSRGQQALLQLSITGLCQLRCQRCLGSLAYPIQLKTALRLVSAADARAEDDMDDDESDSIEASEKLDVLELIEEEILLGLPFAPRHEKGACESAVEGVQALARNPFAVLAALKNK
jgi:uncharacterized protein